PGRAVSFRLTAPGDDWLAAVPPLAALDRGPMPARVGNVGFGTASWTDRSLLASRAFYPPAASTPERRLRYYARHFPVVEVDATYYALPSAANARAWAARTPDDFAFGVKAYAALTQHPLEPARLDQDLQRALPRAHARLPPPRRLRVRVGRRAARHARERAAGGGADLRRARRGPLPRPQRGGVGQARRRHGGALRVRLSRGRAQRVGAEDPPPRRQHPPGARAHEQLPPPLRRAEREGPGRPAGRSLPARSVTRDGGAGRRGRHQGGQVL